ncbi:DUF4145 domain-containing protein [Vibrio sp. 99-8-1]|nr:DUF4145 domain-containing protein [Vibrio sp. 99-8-1]
MDENKGTSRLSSYTDIALCQSIDPRIEGYYTSALRYGASIPDYALIQYRKAAECICDVLIHHHQQPFSSKNSLWKKIQFLQQHNFIDAEFAQQLSTIRENANNGAHHGSDDEGKFDNKQTIVQRIAETNACLVSCLKFCHFAIRGEEVLEVTSTAVAMAQNSEIILESLTSINWDTHFRAGLAYEAMITDAIIIHHKLRENEAQNMQLLLSHYRGAINCYETAFKLSCSDVSIDFNDFSQPLPQLSDLEGHQLDLLFNYCRVLLTSGVMENQVANALTILEFAADQGHSKSAGFLGNALYEEGQYKSAKALLIQAAEQLDDNGLCGLFLYYSEGKAVEPDNSKALYYIEKGLKQSSVQCLGLMGAAYYNGFGRTMDRKKGLELAKLAMQKGSLSAYQFIKEVELNSMRDFYLSTQLTSTAQNALPGRNDPCPCGSGKKYKKCCYASVN